MYILGISALYHDSAAALICDGEIISAAQEERFTRKKSDLSIPVHAIEYCLCQAGIEIEDLEAVVYYDDPVLTLDRFLGNLKAIDTVDMDSFLEHSFSSMFQVKMWIEELLKEAIGGMGKRGRLLVAKHHMSHAASAFYPSPFQKAAIITVDGVGEWNTTTIGFGEGNSIKLIKEINYPHSLGLLYSAFTYFCGFRVNYGDYKLMGLAPYGQPVYYDLIKKELIDVKEDGSFRLNLKYFDFQNGRTMTNDAFSELFGGKPRKPESVITKREMDLAASVQKVTEEIIIKLAKTARRITGQSENLVMAGGVALNCVANGKLLKENIFKNIWVQPAAGDAGGALGAALLAYHELYHGERKENGGKDKQKGSFLGPEYDDETIKKYLCENGYPYVYYADDEEFFEKVAEELDKQSVIGLFEGRMEFGPRALGHRSIIADPRSQSMQAKLNLSIKKRESFRPFAPAVLAERCQDYFEMEQESPYMLFCAEVKNRLNEDFSVQESLAVDENMLSIINMKRSEIPAVTHVDYSARIQTVSEVENPIFYRIIKAFEKKTGCGVVVNTSFNVRGEPIVCTLEDAFDCFMDTEMDVLVLGHCILHKQDQDMKKERKHREYELD